MDFRLRIVLVVGTMLSFALVARISKKARMEAKDAANWLVICIVMTLAAVFPNGVDAVSKLFGISVASNAVFAATIFGLLCMVFYLNIRISRLSIQMRELVQKLSLLERRLRDMGVDDLIDGQEPVDHD